MRRVTRPDRSVPAAASPLSAASSARERSASARDGSSPEGTGPVAVSTRRTIAPTTPRRRPPAAPPRTENGSACARSAASTPARCAPRGDCSTRAGGSGRIEPVPTARRPDGRRAQGGPRSISCRGPEPACRRLRRSGERGRVGSRIRRPGTLHARSRPPANDENPEQNASFAARGRPCARAA